MITGTRNTGCFGRFSGDCKEECEASGEREARDGKLELSCHEKRRSLLCVLACYRRSDSAGKRGEQRAKI